MRNNLAELLADIVDDEHLALAVQLDEHLRMRWNASADEKHKLIMAEFERSPSTNAMAEFAVYILLMEAMLEDDVRSKQVEGGV